MPTNHSPHRRNASSSAADSGAGVTFAAATRSSKQPNLSHAQLSAARFAALAEATGQIVWTTTADGMIEDIPSWRKFTGQTVAEVRGWGWLDAIHPADRAQAEETWQTAIATKTLYATTYRVRRADGVYRTFQARGTAVLDSHGAIREWVGISTDITEQAQLAGALQRQEREARLRAQELETILNTMTDGVAICDVSGAFTQVNPAFIRITGEPLIGAPLAERHRAWRTQRVDASPLPLAEMPVQRVLRGETLAGANVVDVQISRPDGSQIAVGVSGAPLRDAQGAITGAIMIVRDVTERRQLEQRSHNALNALLAMAHLLVAGDATDTPDAKPASMRQTARHIAALTCDVMECDRLGITTVDPQTGVMRPLTIVGLAPEDERIWWEAQATETRLADSPMPDLVAALLRGETIFIDMRQPPFDTQPNPFNVRSFLIAPMRIGEQLVGLLTLDHGSKDHEYSPEEMQLAGGVAQLAALAIERDRLARERAEARASEIALREANRRMDEFLALASHEIKTPLTAIKASVQLAERRLRRATPEQAPEALAATVNDILQRGERQIGRLARLVDDLLDVSRIQADKLELRPADADLLSIARDVVEEQRNINPERTITLTLPDGAAIPIHADPDRIGQVVANYLTNALKYSPADQPVAVTVKRTGERAIVQVRDQGPGLAPAEQERIWQRFYRAPGVMLQSGTGVGLGLGLHISRTIIERSGGEVGIASIPGEGATFWFCLPLATGG